jgi:pyruvate dehydrogenase E2 component (dihydrolipoamide acetyltransferase)
LEKTGFWNGEKRVPEEIKMPALGQTTDEMVIVKWLKAEGESIAVGEPLLEVDTDKATLQVESVAAGTVLKILHGAGETVRAGTLMAWVGRIGEEIPEQGKELGGTERGIAGTRGELVGTQLAPTEVADKSERVLASPVARQLAKEHGIDLTQIRGSGSGGRIERRDVLARIEAATRVEGVSRHRVAMAQRLTRSIQNIPQITLTATVVMKSARDFLSAPRGEGLPELSYTHLILRAVAAALRQHPRLNRLWVADGPQFRPLPRADVGLAVAGEDTLLVVTIPEPDRLGWNELARVTQDAVRRARSGALVQTDTMPTAITVSNLGMYGVDEFHAIVDPDQTAILATGKIVEQVSVVNGGIHILPQMRMSLTVDHRVADGVLAAQFLNTLREYLESSVI